MTEAEWLAWCEDPELRLGFLRGKVSDRRLRLFAVACCRIIWDILTPFYRRTVETAERVADGEATRAALQQAQRMLRRWQRQPFFIAEAVLNASHEDAFSAALGACAIRPPGMDAMNWTVLAPILYCIFGNLFRSVSFDANLLKWNCEALPKMAKKIYDEGAFELLPILADALQEAGCKDAHILDHCRTPSVHVRGCWLVDLLLGKT